MKKSLLFISLVLALAFTTVGSAAVSAAKPFAAMGTISSISPTILYYNVFPAGKSERWRVVDRVIGGEFQSGPIAGPFTLTYKANVDGNQVGNLHGTLQTISCLIQVNGNTQPAEVWGWYVPDVIPLYKVAISGNWRVIEGAIGDGDFIADIVFIPEVDEYGNVHVGPIIIDYSPFTMSGSWKP